MKIRNWFLCSTIIFIAISILYPVGSTEAQLINYKRKQIQTFPSRNSNNTTPFQSSGHTLAKVTNQETKSIVSKADTLIESGPYVENQVERLYDYNQDGQLQSSEILEFYHDVEASVKRRGGFTVTSQLLAVFDEDSNGHIDLQEGQLISNYLK